MQPQGCLQHMITSILRMKKNVRSHRTAHQKAVSKSHGCNLGNPPQAASMSSRRQQLETVDLDPLDVIIPTEPARYTSNEVELVQSRSCCHACLGWAFVVDVLLSLPCSPVRVNLRLKRVKYCLCRCSVCAWCCWGFGYSMQGCVRYGRAV